MARLACGISTKAITVARVLFCGSTLQRMSSKWCLLAMQVDGDWRYDARRSSMLWTIDLVDDQNRSGSMEFVVRVNTFCSLCRAYSC